MQPLLCRLVAMQHIVARNRGHHERNRNGLQQFFLGRGGTRAGSHFLLDEATAIQLFQHTVETIDQAPEFVARIPVGAQL